MSDSEENNYAIKKEEFIKRKSSLFAETTNLSDRLNKPTNFQAQAGLRQLEAIEQQFRNLQIEIFAHNACADKTNLVSEKDFSTFTALFTSIAEKCYAALQNPTPVISDNYSRAKLAPIEIPVFDGKISDYLKFKSLYDSLVHNDKNLTEIDKFQYLLTYTDKEAKSVVGCFELVSAQYQLAYDALVNRYSNSRRLAAYYVNQLLQFRLNDSTSDLTSFLQLHRSSIAALKSLNLNNLGDFILFEITYSNCSSSVQHSFDNSFNSDTIPTLDELLKFIEKQARSKELRMDSDSLGSKKMPSPNLNKKSFIRKCLKPLIPYNFLYGSIN